MKDFVFWVTVIVGLELFFRIVCLGMGALPDRTKGGMVIDTLIGAGLVLWGVSLLSR